MDHGIPEDVSGNINCALLPTNDRVRVVLHKRACLSVEILTNLIDEGRSAENRSKDLQLSYTFSWEESAGKIRDQDSRRQGWPTPCH